MTPPELEKAAEDWVNKIVTAPDYDNHCFGPEAFIAGAQWMQNEIIKALNMDLINSGICVPEAPTK